jgi:hypothetical protein
LRSKDQGRLPTVAVVADKLDEFIRFNNWPLLQGRGYHSRDDANAHALEQLDLYRERVNAEAGEIAMSRTARKGR